MIAELDCRTIHKYSGTGLTSKTVTPEPKRSFINISAIDSEASFGFDKKSFGFTV